MRQTVPMIQLTDTTQAGANITPPMQQAEGACLVKIYPAHANGGMIPLTTKKLVLGRDTTCDHELIDEFASRAHATIEWEDGAYVIEDLGSTNGTFVNDLKITRQPLEPGDQLRIGHQIFKFLSADHVEAMYHEAVFQMMTVDVLTQTYNRRYFEGAFEREVTRTIRHGRTLGLLMIDIDHFKETNDEYGHLVGDELLAGVCKRISTRVRGDEVFARIGGEEFALVCVEITKDQLRNLANEIRTLVSDRPFQTAKGDVSITISIGAIHTTGLMPNTPNELMEQADAKLYEAKSLGRNIVCMG